MRHNAIGSGQFGGINVPLLGGSADQHLASGGARNAHAHFAGEANGAAAAGDLHVHYLGSLHSDGIHRAIQEGGYCETQRTGKSLDQYAVGKQIGRRSLFNIHLAPVSIHFVSGHHWQ